MHFSMKSSVSSRELGAPLEERPTTSLFRSRSLWGAVHGACILVDRLMTNCVDHPTVQKFEIRNFVACTNYMRNHLLQSSRLLIGDARDDPGVSFLWHLLVLSTQPVWLLNFSDVHSAC